MTSRRGPAWTTKYGYQIRNNNDYNYYLNLKETKWRSGKPDYTLANHVFLKGKTQNHKRGKNNTFPPKKRKKEI